MQVTLMIKAQFHSTQSRFPKFFLVIALTIKKKNNKTTTSKQNKNSKTATKKHPTAFKLTTIGVS